MKKDNIDRQDPATPTELFEFENLEENLISWDDPQDEFAFSADVEREPEEPSSEEISKLLAALQEPAKALADGTSLNECQDSEESQVPQPASDFVPLANGGDQQAIEELRNDSEMCEAYLDDALKCLDSMEQSALELESAPRTKEPVQQFCRELHTLKGASASVGLSELASYLHELETSLEKVFGSESEITETGPMFAAVDRVREEIANVSAASAEPKSPEGTPSTGRGPAQSFSEFGNCDEASIRIRAAKLDRLMDMLAELVVLRNRRENHVSEFNQLNDELNRCATRLRYAEEQPELDLSRATNVYSSSSQAITEIAKDITAVAQGLGELQKPVSHDNQSISRFIRDFRQELMQLRRLPIAGLFHRLQRSVRDAAQTESKLVRLEILAANTGLEQETQEKLFEPFLHIVRNAVSHGIESPEERACAGKDATGTITIQSYSNAQRLVVEVRDDGCGIDFAAVQKRAISKGLISGTQSLSENELGKLIFHPGFSTREQASEVSGRGVGMDIVATTIEQLRGRVDVESTRGEGTTMRITIPLRSGIEHVMVFRAAGQLFALPMQAVSAVNECQSGLGAHLDLSRVLSLPGTVETDQRDVIVLRNSKHAEDREPLVLSVDEMVGPEEVVIRGLPKAMQNHPLCCGVSLSGSGETVLLLDSQRLQEFCQTHQDAFDVQSATVEPSAEMSDQIRALVVDDSMTARKILVKKLQAQGIVSVEASDGIEALERLHREPFDLVFTDLDMPRLGGIELLADIKSQKYTEAPVVIVSSRSDKEFRNQVMEMGAVAYLNKPIEQTLFTDLLEELQLKAK